MISFVSWALFMSAFLRGSLACTVNQEDTYIIKEILEKLVINDCKTMLTLSGIFFENQQKPPNTVKVTYKIQIPDNPSCYSKCPCWKKSCNAKSSKCDPGYCCFERNILWGRIPMYVQDSIFRELTMCSLVVGGFKEQSITISLNVTNEENTGQSIEDENECTQLLNFPCSWCHTKHSMILGLVQSDLWLDSAITISPPNSPVDRALLSITAKLQGYAARTEKLDWLMYNSDLAFGYSQPYKVTFELSSRLAMFLTYYTFFQTIIFMLIYKYRYRMYNRICQYINKNQINRSLFWSIILSTVLGFICIMAIALLAGGICISILQLLMLGIAVAFGFPHTIVVCFRMKKIASRFALTDRKSCCCLLFNNIVPKLLFSYIYILPHILFFCIINYFVSFVARPFSYLLLLVYLGVSSVFIWIANAIGIKLLFPLSCNMRGSVCRRQVFAILLIVACNCLNFSTWTFIAAYFYDRRAHATSFLTVLPGIIFTSLGWYLSGDMVKLFDVLVPTFASQDAENNHFNPPGINDDPESESLVRSHSNADDDPMENHNDEQVHPRQRYNFSRLKKMMGLLQRPQSVVQWGLAGDGADRDAYVNIDLSDNDD